MSILDRLCGQQPCNAQFELAEVHDMKQPFVTAVFLGWCLVCAAAGQEVTPSVERSLIVSGQGYFPVALRLQDGRIAVVLRGGAPPRRARTPSIRSVGSGTMTVRFFSLPIWVNA